MSGHSSKAFYFHGPPYIQINMKISGLSNEIQRILNMQKYGAWYFENVVYFDQFLSLKQED